MLPPLQNTAKSIAARVKRTFGAANSRRVFASSPLRAILSRLAESASERLAFLSSWRFFAILAVFVVLTVCVFALLAEFPVLFARHATLTSVQGTAEATGAAASDWQPLAPGVQLGEGERLRATRNGAVLTLFDGSTVTLLPGADVTLSSMRSGLFGASFRVVLRQQAGTVRYRVNPLHSPQSVFEVQSPTALVRARGTEFTMAVDDALDTEVAVLQGSADVAGPLDATVLEGGETALVAANAPIRPPTSGAPAANGVPGDHWAPSQIQTDDTPEPTIQPTATSEPGRPTPTPAPTRTAEATPTPEPTVMSEPTRSPSAEGPEGISGSTGDPLIWPISGSEAPDLVNSPFGPRWRTTQNRYDYHGGLDLPAPENAPVHVAADGVVTSAGWRSTGGGLTIIVYHPALDLYTAYLHLNAALVSKDQAVTQGQVIGLVGNTGSTNFMHLHFETRVPTTDYRSATRNPMGYLPRPDAAAPEIEITGLDVDDIRHPTVSVMVTAPCDELDVNQVRVTLEDLATGAIVDQQMVDLNERLHAGDDSLDQDGFRLIPSPFNSWTPEYELAVEFYQLHAQGAFRVIAEAVDLAGNADTAVATAGVDTQPSQR